jgi:hypothetical protein
MASAVDHKLAADQISNASSPQKDAEAARGGMTHGYGNLEVPPLVAAMTPEDRAQQEKSLVRKIDTRLLPMVILMYVMNYLDRNNIAAVRLAGLQDELDLSSPQYQVCGILPGRRITRSNLCRLLSVFFSWDIF